MAVLCGMPTIQYSARSACIFKLNDVDLATSLSSVMTDIMSRDSIVDRHCLRQRYVPYAINSRSTSLKIWGGFCTEYSGQGNDSELIPTIKIENRHPVEWSFGNEFSSLYNHCGAMAA